MLKMAKTKTWVASERGDIEEKGKVKEGYLT